MNFLDNVNWTIGAVLTVAIFVGVAIGILSLIRYCYPKEKFKANHDVFGYTYGVIGVVYAVLLGFNVVNVQERFNHALEISEQEANAVADLYRDAATLPDPYAKKIQDAIYRYIQISLKDEWSENANGFAAESVIKQVGIIWNLYYKVEPTTEREKIWLAQSISKLNDFTNIRLKRVYNSHESLGTIMWVLLYVGAIIMIGFLGFFWVEDFKVHLIMTSLLAALIGFMIYLIQALDSVYKGAIAIKPEALTSVQELLTKWY